MALTYNALIDLAKQETQGLSLRSLGELTTCRNEIGLPIVRNLLINLFSLKLLFGFAGASKAVDLVAALTLLLERYEYGEIARGRAVLDLTNRVFSRLIELSGSLETHTPLGARIGIRSRSVRTQDLEEELSRLLNLEEFPRSASLLNVTSRAASRDSLVPYIERGHEEGSYITLAAMNLLEHGEELPELLTILESHAVRGVLLSCGLLELQAKRSRMLGVAAPQQSIAYLIFRTEAPWQPRGSFSRLPAFRVATLYDPRAVAGDGEGWTPEVPPIDPELVARALAGELREPDEGPVPEERALVPAGETGLATLESKTPARASERRASLRQRIQELRERRTTIGFKLIFITSLILVVSLTAMILVASSFFRQDVTVRIEENNHTLAQVTALDVQREFQTIVSNTQLFLNMVSRFSTVPEAAQILKTAFFAQSTGIGYVGIPGSVGFFNDSLLDGRQLHHEDVLNAINAHPNALKAVASSITSVINLSPQLKSPMLAIILPYHEGNTLEPLAIVSALDPFVQAVQTSGITQTFVVNAKGQLIVDPDLTLLGGDIDYSKLPIVRSMLKSPIDNGELQYTDTNHVRYLGSFKRVPFAGIGVVTTAPTRRAFEAVRAIERRNLYLMVAVLAIAILVVYFFSKTITRPVGRLVDAARQVEVGNFLLELKATTRDEIGLLTESFVHMGRGLHERERIKDAFGKFVSKSVAEQVMREEVRLGGERRAATIFFSDIRSFTSISEKLQPEEVVEFLNEYMTRMVECVNETGGVVDKFIGDAIMAVWGIPVSRGNDAENAVNGALMMRAALQEFNRGRGTASRPVIRIGCGINSGPVVAGQIGSTERMEYTVIGDPVNLASRIEALNKPFGTDILISQDTYELVKDLFEVVPQLKIKVKGKSEPQQIYAILGRKDDLHRPKSLRELQRLIGVDPAALKKHKTEGEEVKYEILDE